MMKTQNLLPKVDLQWETTKLCKYNFVGSGHSDTQQVLEKASVQYFCRFTNAWIHGPYFTSVAQDR